MASTTNFAQIVYLSRLIEQLFPDGSAVRNSTALPVSFEQKEMEMPEDNESDDIIVDASKASKSSVPYAVTAEENYNQIVIPRRDAVLLPKFLAAETAMEARIAMQNTMLGRRLQRLEFMVNQSALWHWFNTRKVKDKDLNVNDTALAQSQFVYTEATYGTSVPFIDYGAWTLLVETLGESSLLQSGEMPHAFVDHKTYGEMKRNDRDFLDAAKNGEPGIPGQPFTRIIDGVMVHVVPSTLLPVFSGGDGSWAPSPVGTAANGSTHFSGICGFVPSAVGFGTGATLQFNNTGDAIYQGDIHSAKLAWASSRLRKDGTVVVLKKTA